MTLRRWTARDEANLRRRIIDRIVAPRAVAPVTPRPAVVRLDEVPECCVDDHRHAAVRVPPFVICRCVRCPVLVVRP